MTIEAWTVIGVGVALLSAILLQGRDLGARIDALGADLRADLRELGERVAKIEGLLEGLQLGLIKRKEAE